MYTGDGAEWGAFLDPAVFLLEVFLRVRLQRNSRCASLLGTVVNQTVFTDIEVASTGMAVPLGRQPSDHVPLE